MSTNAIRRTGKLALLSKAGLFSQLREAELRTISRYSGYRTFAEGELIFPEGSHREELYLIKNGRVVIRRGGNGEGQDIARFVAGEVFGEMDLLDSAPRSASAFAEESTTLLVFPHEVPFQELLEKHPYVFARILRKLLGEIAGRIRAIDRLVSEKSPWIEELKRQLLRDKLSGLYNRAFLEEELPRLLAAARPREPPCREAGQFQDHQRHLRARGRGQDARAHRGRPEILPGRRGPGRALPRGRILRRASRASRP